MLAGRDPLDARFESNSTRIAGLYRRTKDYNPAQNLYQEFKSPLQSKHVSCLKLPARGKFSDRIGFACRTGEAV